MRPRHECLPFGGPHRHGIHYSTRTPGKSPNRAKIPQRKKIRADPTARHLNDYRYEERGGKKVEKRDAVLKKRCARRP